MLTKQGVFGEANVLGIGDAMTGKAARLPAPVALTKARKLGGGLFASSLDGAMTARSSTVSSWMPVAVDARKLSGGGLFRGGVGTAEFPTAEEEAEYVRRAQANMASLRPEASASSALRSLVAATQSQAARSAEEQAAAAAAESESWIAGVPNVAVIVGGLVLAGGGLWMALRK